MSALVTDQFRILNASNFVESFSDEKNSYYITVGLPNPTIVGYGRSNTWNTNPPAPIDNLDYNSHSGDVAMFGRRVTGSNVRRLVRRIDYVQGNRYEMYRNDYSILNPAPLTNASRLYDANYYVMNSDYRVYICIDNGASAANTAGNFSQDEPTFIDLEPSRAGESGDGYIWKYLFTVSPSDIIKFDSTEYIALPSDWDTTSANSQIVAVRNNANSDVNENQIKKVYIEAQGAGYSQGSHEVNILGDGSGGKVVVEVNSSGQITDVVVSSGGSGYTYGIVDLGSINTNASTRAELIVIIPPSKGHGYDIYKELGADKVLVYARFDDSTRDFPVDTSFAQIGIVKNPVSYGSTSVYTENEFSSLGSIKFSSVVGSVSIGEKISQSITGETAKAEAYVSSYDTETNVLKYFQDRNLFLNQTTFDTVDYAGISTSSKVLGFSTSGGSVTGTGGFSGSIENFTGISTNPTGSKLISLGVQFTQGLATPEINKGSGDIIYLDNRPLISRNSRQKEDVKIILEF